LARHHRERTGDQPRRHWIGQRFSVPRAAQAAHAALRSLDIALSLNQCEPWGEVLPQFLATRLKKLNDPTLTCLKYLGFSKKDIEAATHQRLQGR